MLQFIGSRAGYATTTVARSMGGSRPKAAVQLGIAGLQVLVESDPLRKIELTRELAEELGLARLAGGIAPGMWDNATPTASLMRPMERMVPPEEPARPAKPVLVGSKEMKRPANVPLHVYLLHSLAHVELNAIDLYWDTIVRFYHLPLPDSMYTDFLRVILDECDHYIAITERLAAAGYAYGDLPAHKGLWEHAYSSRHDLKARIVVIPLVQEARALDAGPRLQTKFVSCDDKLSAQLVKRIVDEEVPHVSAGIKWFKYLCEKEKLDPIPTFHDLIQKHVPGKLHGPFNDAARAQGGMPPEWYLPVSSVATSFTAAVDTEAVTQ